ncbi:hypothetical protein GGR57DRAFT_215906 [Xylariaceae sp. FL1272]|nr:hypothetical protein GGR57DRAFT_215906 [Xylariaceae sp. FL1272]
MLQRLLLGAALYSGLGQAATGSAVTTTSTVVCSANYGSSKPTAVTTSSTTTVISSLKTAPAITVPLEYTRVTADAVTTTQHATTSVDVIIATVTSGTFQAYSTELTTLATATWPVTVCTNDVEPTTVTKFTGAYTPLPGQPSQSSGGPGSYITEVVCTTSIISSIQLFPTLTAPTTATIVTTPTVTITDITASTMSTLTYATVTTWSTTVTSLIVSYTPAHTVKTISTACEPTATVTLNARCHPVGGF